MRCSLLALDRLGQGAVAAARCQAVAHRAFSAAGDGQAGEASTSGAGSEETIIAACVLQRLPLLRPQLSSSQREHEVWARHRALEEGELKDYPTPAAQATSGRGEPAGRPEQQDLRTFSPVPLQTAADASGDTRTMRRRLGDSLYLVVRDRHAGAPAGQAGGGKPPAAAGDGASGGGGSGGSGGGGWFFPQAPNQPGESIGDTAARALYGAISRRHPVFFVGHAPMAHMRASPAGTRFFLLAQVVDDPWDTKLAPGADLEHAWVTKQELVGSYLSDARMRELVTKML